MQIPKQEIAWNDYDLSVNKYKQTEYKAVEFPPTSEILAELNVLLSMSRTSISSRSFFVHKIVDYVVENGYIESIKVLMLPPFDKPQNFLRLFSDAERKRLMQIVDSIRDNAVLVHSESSGR